MSDSIEEKKGKQLAVLKHDPSPVTEKDAALPHGNYISYPKPLAKYKDVVASAKLFMETLEKLHAAMATKFMVPTIGGRELDLHRLFVEVSSRGGIEKVIGDRRWREVTAVFSFPSTATNASFVLRKYYMSLLHHYEQIYFFGSQGWVSPPTASHATSATSSPSQRLVEPMMPLRETQVASQKRRRSNGEFASAGPSLPANREVVGVIDGKFEHGYFVTVTVGTEKLKGILYPVPEQTAVQSGIAENSNVKGVRRRRRRKKLSKRDPTHPKPNRSGYNFFFAEQHARLKPLHPGKDREISKMIGDLWNKSTETEKAVYQERGLKDKERYRSEMVVYKERLKMGQVISNAVPIQQRPAEPDVVMEDVDSKMEMDEGDLPATNQNESSSDGSDSEGKMSGEDSETETSPEVGGTAAESSSLVVEHSIEGVGFELRKRDSAKMEDEHDLPSSSEDTESKKVTES